MASPVVRVILALKDEFTAQLGGATDRIRRFAAATQSVFRAVSIFFVTGIVARGVRAIVDAATEGEISQRRLQATLKATGNAAGLTFRQLDQLASQIQQTTLFDDEQARNAITALTTFRNVQGAVFTRAIALSADLAAVLGSDLQSAALKLGKALNDPTRGLDGLNLALTTTQRAMIRSLVETGQQAKAQQLILQELANKVGGAAEGEAGGLAGTVRGVTKDWQDFLEQLGKISIFDTLASKIRTVIDHLKMLVTPNTEEQFLQRRLDAIRSVIQSAERATPGSMVALPKEALAALRAEAQQILKDLSALRIAQADSLRAEEEGAKKAAAALRRLATVEAKRLALLAEEEKRRKGLAAAVAKLPPNPVPRFDLRRAGQRALGRSAPTGTSAPAVTPVEQTAIDLGFRTIEDFLTPAQRLEAAAKKAVEQQTLDLAELAEQNRVRAQETARAWERAAERISDALARAVFEGGNALERLANLAREVAQSILASLLQTGIVRLGQAAFGIAPLAVPTAVPATATPTGPAFARAGPGTINIQQTNNIQTGLPIQVIPQFQQLARQAGAEGAAMVLARSQGRR